MSALCHINLRRQNLNFLTRSCEIDFYRWKALLLYKDYDRIVSENTNKRVYNSYISSKIWDTMYTLFKKFHIITFFFNKNVIIAIQNLGNISRYYLLFYSIIQNWFILQLLLYIILEGVKYSLFLKFFIFYIEITCSMSYFFSKYFQIGDIVKYELEQWVWGYPRKF